ncbi:MAG: hypothetical protein DI547_00540 [Sphingobium sp.]|nr:MAG: hypothetical protein DI547_00540 [Sphingobium sp.]
MIAAMSARPPLDGATWTSGHGRFASAAGFVVAPVAHALDLSRFLPFDERGWTDALVSATRRHLAGCLNGVEASIVAELAADGHLSAEGWAPRAWTGAQAHPQLIEARLIAHMRCRATVGLLARMQGVSAGGASPAAPTGEDFSWLHDDAGGELAMLAQRVALAEQRWGAVGAEDDAMAPDLPADMFSDIVWTVTALIGGKGEVDRHALVDVAQQTCARHEDAGTPIEATTRIAALLDTAGHAGEALGKALGQRRLLLFAALAGRMLGVDTQAMLHLFVHAPAAELAAICHALGGADTEFRHLLLQLKVARTELNDSAILALARDYDGLGGTVAEQVVAVLRGPAELRAKLALLDTARAG